MSGNSRNRTTNSAVVLAAAILFGAATANARGEQLGPFVALGKGRTTIVSPNCEPVASTLDCQVAVASIILSENKLCRVLVTSYRLLFKKAAGRWSASSESEHCSLKNEFILETEEGKPPSIARLRVHQTYRDRSPACAKVGFFDGEKISKTSESVFEYSEKQPLDPVLGCERFSVPGFAKTIPFLSGSPASK